MSWGCGFHRSSNDNVQLVLIEHFGLHENFSSLGNSATHLHQHSSQVQFPRTKLWKCSWSGGANGGSDGGGGHPGPGEGITFRRWDGKSMAPVVFPLLSSLLCSCSSSSMLSSCLPSFLPSFCSSPIGAAFCLLSAQHGGEAVGKKLSAVKKAQLEAKAAVKRVVLLLLKDPFWKAKSPRLVVDRALQLISRDEPLHTFWGANSAYSRCRSLLDSFLVYDWSGVFSEAFPEA